jgi:catechol 2,3-dioxygenase
LTSVPQITVPFGIPPPGFRLPAATRIGRVRLQIASLRRSLDYYTRVVGLHVLSATESSAALGAHGDSAVLVELSERTGVRRVPSRGLLGLYHFAILLPDRPALGRFVEHIGRLGVRAGTADHAVSESVYLTDPDGLGIEVYADRPRERWQANGSELYITVEPLDLHSLVNDAAGEPWAGMPAGTIVGHVHLSVGALDAAAAFYHSGLGFDKTAWGFPGALFLAAGGYHHHLGTNTWAAGAPAATDDDARLLEWELVLPDAEAVTHAAQSIAGAGYRMTADGADRIALDPWGTPLRLRSGS